MEFTAEDLWSRVLEKAQEYLNEQTYRTWLGDTVAVSLTDSDLLVEAPSQFHVEWLEDKYGAFLADVLRKILGRSLNLRIECGAPSSPSPLPNIEFAAGVNSSPISKLSAENLPPSFLNQRYTFDRFVVGDNSRLAAAACQAVAQSPARTYNPLFLYGGVGLGKTHLMHATGNAISKETPSSRTVYLSAEQFTNNLVAAIQKGTTAKFRQLYRQTDLLLVDDVQFLEGKERTQEEFFYTFNALYDARKQIILTSDRPPKEIPGLAERLISRFEWGLVADINKPDYETRMAILIKKAADDNLTLEHNVIDLIARFCTSSVRELEGAVIKLLAYSSLTNQEITTDLAKIALKGTFGGQHGPSDGEVTPKLIREAVAKDWRVSEDALGSKRRTKDLTVPRQVAMYLIKDILGCPLAQIGRMFGDRDHSTVIHSIRKVEEKIERDPSFRIKIESIREKVGDPD
jgi:chromosomal replication initiator protein